MNINYKQPQFELFPANSASLEDINKPKILLANLTLSIESLVILTILGIMVALFSFSLGVERGKHLAAQALDERVSAAWNVAPRKTVPVQAMAAVKPAAAIVPAAGITAPQANVKSTLGNAGFVAMQVKPVVPAAPANPAAKFTVQVASYKSEVYARQEALTLKAKGLGSFLIKKGDLWLVCVGQFAASEGAAGLVKRVRAKYPDSTIRRF